MTFPLGKGKGTQIMKVSAQQYAKALYEVTKGKSEKEIDAAVLGFVKILQKNNQLGLKKDISKKFHEIYNQENGIVEAEVISREKLNSQLVDKLIRFIKEKYSAKEVVINSKIDEGVKGGIIVKVGDEIIDGSIEKQLNNLRNILIS